MAKRQRHFSSYVHCTLYIVQALQQPCTKQTQRFISHNSQTIFLPSPLPISQNTLEGDFPILLFSFSLIYKDKGVNTFRIIYFNEKKDFKKVYKSGKKIVNHIFALSLHE